MIILRPWELEHDQVTYLLLQGTMNHPKVTAVIGSGASAVTTLRALKNLASEPQKGVGVVWITRHGPEPYQLIDNDPLPQRRALYRLDENLNSTSFNQIHTLQTYFFSFSMGNKLSLGTDTADFVSFSYHGNSQILEVQDNSAGGVRLVLENAENGEISQLCVDNVISNVGYRYQSVASFVKN